MPSSFSTQEEYDTLLASLEFYENKISELEPLCDGFRQIIELYDLQELSKKLEELNYKGKLSKEDLDKAEELIKKIEKYPLVDKEEVIAEINSTYDDLDTLYNKQITITDEILSFIEREKFNSEVEIRINIDALTPLKDIVLQMKNKRKELKKVLLEGLNNDRRK